MQYTLNFIVKDVQKNEKKFNPKPIAAKYLELLSYVLLEHKDVSKIATSPKQILKQKSITVLTLPKKKEISIFRSGSYE